MTKRKTKKLPLYLQELDGRYFVRVPVKRELVPYLGQTQLREALGPDLRTAKENLHQHVARFKEQIRVAAESYARDTGKQVLLTANPIAPEKIMVQHYRDFLAFDDEARLSSHLYASAGYADEDYVARLRRGISGALSNSEYMETIGHRINRYRRFGQTTAEPGTDDFRTLAMAICIAEYEGLSRSAERDEGDFTGKPEHPVLIEAINAVAEEQAQDDIDSEFAGLTFEKVIEEQERLNAMGLSGRTKSEATLKKYRNAVYDFEHYRRDKKVATVTIADGKSWRDHMLHSGEISRKTIHDKITVIRTLMNWANSQAEGKLFPDGEPWARLALPTVEKGDSAERTYSLKEARHLLKCASTATRASNRWIPWIIAHTGARVNEITPLEKADISEIEGHWFIHIRVGDGRTTKTGKARRVPVHRALIKEGFIDFVKTQPEGRLFPGGKNEDQRIREWIHEKVFPGQDDMPPPNHGFRHLFEDALFNGVSQKAALYITGRSSGSSADEYGGSELRLIEIAKQMEKVRDIVEQT